ncbi:hypothetical protein C8R42DRAFT_690585 [Lentinula raphanica]|nr:hypothetical protein C8R42DRAFT_690585 [Lentinula raphanica]
MMIISALISLAALVFAHLELHLQPSTWSETYNAFTMSVITRGSLEEVKKAHWISRIILHCPQFFIDPMAVICLS